jgi:basic membrane lipoprotein Med (substrate-binding protein (PBP1-ABC) superfamily)
MAENINGIQVDVSAVLADRIAEMAVATVSKEQLELIGKRALIEVSSDKGDGWNKRPSDVQKLATEKFYSEVSKYFDELISLEEYQQKAKEEAEKIIEEMKQNVHNKLVNNITGQLSAQYCDPYGSMFHVQVAQIVNNMMQIR